LRSAMAMFRTTTSCRAGMQRGARDAARWTGRVKRLAARLATSATRLPVLQARGFAAPPHDGCACSVLRSARRLLTVAADGMGAPGWGSGNHAPPLIAWQSGRWSPRPRARSARPATTRCAGATPGRPSTPADRTARHGPKVPTSRRTASRCSRTPGRSRPARSAGRGRSER
jgi:hypothetical protein